MLKIKAENGTVHEVADIDINVYSSESTGTVRLVAYPCYEGKSGYLETDTNVTLFRADLGKDMLEDFSEDGEWYGWVDALPGFAPEPIIRTVNNILKEISL